MREHEIYFLQRQNGDIWDTLLSAETSEALEEALSEAIADAIPAALRIAVGDYQTETNAWTYQQIFFLDKNSYRLPHPAMRPQRRSLSPKNSGISMLISRN